MNFMNASIGNKEGKKEVNKEEKHSVKFGPSEMHMSKNTDKIYGESK